MSSMLRCLVFLMLVSGCADVALRSVDQRGESLFADPRLSSSPANRFSCSTCHDASAPDVSRRKPGAPLAGVLERTSYWGGQRNDLLESINDCLTYFMQSQEPLQASAPEAEALYAFLAALGPLEPAPIPFTIVETIDDLPLGDARHGAELYQTTCQPCHGTATRGAGRITPLAPVLPDDTLRAHLQYPNVRLIFIEKVRHGPFLGYEGFMPPFSLEALNHGELSDILEFLGVFDED